MLDPEVQAEEDLRLCDVDFPEDYVKYAHPDDGQSVSKPIQPEYTFVHREGKHNKLIFRCSWKTGEHSYVPVSFVLDTGAGQNTSPFRLQEFTVLLIFLNYVLYIETCLLILVLPGTGKAKHLYLCKAALSIFQKAGLIKEDADLDVMYVMLLGRRCPVEATPPSHQPANMMGLKLLHRLELQLKNDASAPFKFGVSFDFLGA